MKITIFNSDVFSGGYEEWAKEELIECNDVQNPSDEQVLNYSYDLMNDDFNTFEKEFQNVFKYHTHSFVSPEVNDAWFVASKASCFSWYGTGPSEGYKVYTTHPYDENGSLESEIFSGNYDTVKIEDEKGHMYFTHGDHDATITEEIRELTERGKAMLMNYYWGSGPLEKLSEFEIYKKLWCDSHYSKLPRLCERINKLYDPAKAAV